MKFLTRHDPFWNIVHNFWDYNLPTTGTALENVPLPPSTDVVEKENEWTFLLDMPGVEDKDIVIKVEGATLAVSGARNARTEETREGYAYSERVHSRFERRFSLPENVDKNDITAKSRNGVLEIHLGKKTEEAPQTISVSG